MSAPIFVSFASRDRRIAETIWKGVESRGFKCWISSRDIRPGENFQESIVRAIRAAKVMLLVFSANSNNSEEIKKELALASQQKVILIPLRVEDVIPNEAFSYELATRQWIDLFDDWESAFEQLMAKIASVVSVGSRAREQAAAAGLPPAPPRRVAAAPSARTVRLPLVVGIAGALMAPALASVWMFSGTHEPQRADNMPAPSSQTAATPSPTTTAKPDQATARLPAQGATMSPAPTKEAVIASPQTAPAVTARELVSQAVTAGLESRYKDELALYLKAAELGDTQAMYNLGTLYHNGKGVPKNDRETMRWYRKAADLGDSLGLLGMGYIYGYGWGVPQDCAAARNWIKKAGAAGYNAADMALATLDMPAFGGTCHSK